MQLELVNAARMTVDDLWVRALLLRLGMPRYHYKHNGAMRRTAIMLELEAVCDVLQDQMPALWGTCHELQRKHGVEYIDFYWWEETA